LIRTPGACRSQSVPAGKHRNDAAINKNPIRNGHPQERVEGRRIRYGFSHF